MLFNLTKGNSSAYLNKNQNVRHWMFLYKNPKYFLNFVLYYLRSLYILKKNFHIFTFGVNSVIFVMLFLSVVSNWSLIAERNLNPLVSLINDLFMYYKKIKSTITVYTPPTRHFYITTSPHLLTSDLVNFKTTLIIN